MWAFAPQAAISRIIAWSSNRAFAKRRATHGLRGPMATGFVRGQRGDGYFCPAHVLSLREVEDALPGYEQASADEMRWRAPVWRFELGQGPASGQRGMIPQ
jgi:hypothetical protein